MTIHSLHAKLQPHQAADLLVGLYQQSHEDAMLCAVFVKSQIPMYTGKLNPAWKFWDDVCKILYPGSTEDSEQAFIRELIEIDNPDLLTTK